MLFVLNRIALDVYPSPIQLSLLWSNIEVDKYIKREWDEVRTKKDFKKKKGERSGNGEGWIKMRNEGELDPATNITMV